MCGYYSMKKKILLAHSDEKRMGANNKLGVLFKNVPTESLKRTTDSCINCSRVVIQINWRGSMNIEHIFHSLTVFPPFCKAPWAA